MREGEWKKGNFLGTKFLLRRLSDGWRVEIGKISLLLKTALFMCRVVSTRQALKENIKPAVQNRLAG